MAIPKIFRDDVLFFQRLMKSCGLYAGNLDGEWGPLSQGAANAFEALYISTKKTYGGFDPRTEGNIATLLPKAQRAARMFLASAKSFKYSVQILSGTRSYAEQTTIYEQGRSRPGRIVTNARAGYSNHNFGIAFDVGIFSGKTYFTGATPEQTQAYIALRAHTKTTAPMLDWGGDWKSMKDRPHYELHTGRSTSVVRAMLEAGKAYV